MAFSYHIAGMAGQQTQDLMYDHPKDEEMAAKELEKAVQRE